MDTTEKTQTLIGNTINKVKDALQMVGSTQEWLLLIIASALIALIIPKILPKKAATKNKTIKFLKERPSWNNITNFIFYTLIWSGVFYLRLGVTGSIGLDDFLNGMGIPNAILFNLQYILIGLIIAVLFIFLASQIASIIKILFLLFLPATSLVVSYLFFADQSPFVLGGVNLFVIAVSLLIYSEFSDSFEEISQLANESAKIICRNILPIFLVLMVTLSILTVKLFMILPLFGYQGHYLISSILIYVMLNWSINLMIGFNKVFISTLVVETKRSQPDSITRNDEPIKNGDSCVKKAFKNAVKSIGTISYFSMVSAVVSGFLSLVDKTIIFLENAKDTASTVSVFYNSARLMMIYTLKVIRFVVSIYVYLVETKIEVGLAYIGVYGNRKSMHSEAENHYRRFSNNSNILRSTVPFLKVMISYISAIVFVLLQLFTGDIDLYGVGSSILSMRIISLEGMVFNVKIFTLFAAIYVIYVMIASAYTATLALDVFYIENEGLSYENGRNQSANKYRDIDAEYETIGEYDYVDPSRRYAYDSNKKTRRDVSLQQTIDNTNVPLEPTEKTSSKRSIFSWLNQKLNPFSSKPVKNTKVENPVKPRKAPRSFENFNPIYMKQKRIQKRGAFKFTNR